MRCWFVVLDAALSTRWPIARFRSHNIIQFFSRKYGKIIKKKNLFEIPNPTQKQPECSLYGRPHRFLLFGLHFRAALYSKYFFFARMRHHGFLMAQSQHHNSQRATFVVIAFCFSFFFVFVILFFATSIFILSVLVLVLCKRGTKLKYFTNFSPQMAFEYEGGPVKQFRMEHFTCLQRNGIV